MATVPLTAVYALPLVIVFLALSVRTIRLRRQFQVGIGAGGQATLERAMRAHANFAEYVPFALLLILFIDLTGAMPLVVHALGALLVIGRISHAWGVSQARENLSFRVFGMALTFIVYAVAVMALGYLTL